MSRYALLETDRQITRYTWGQILSTFKSRQRAFGAMAALYKGANINMDSPKVIINSKNRKYRYTRIDTCFRVVMAFSPLCIANGLIKYDEGLL